jgi:hypothetical protein
VVLLFSFFILPFLNNELIHIENPPLIKSENAIKMDSVKTAFVRYLDKTYAAILIISIEDRGIKTPHNFIPFKKMASIKMNDQYLLRKVAYLNFGSVLDIKKKTVSFNHAKPDWFTDSEIAAYYNSFDNIPELHLSLKVKATASRFSFMGQLSISKQENSSNEISSFGLGVSVKYNAYLDFHLTLRRFEFIIPKFDENGILDENSEKNFTVNGGFSVYYPLFTEKLKLSFSAQAYPIKNLKDSKNSYELLLGLAYSFKL